LKSASSTAEPVGSSNRFVLTGDSVEDLQRMAIFARVVETKSFSAAARDLGLSKSLVSKQVTQLEKSIGARLLNRTTRNMSLTEAGTTFYGHCARIVEELQEAKLAVGRLHSEPRGVLRISVPVAFGRLHIAPALPKFLSSNPQLKIDMVTADRFVDLAEEGYDVVVRIVGEPAPNLVARKLAAVNRLTMTTRSPKLFLEGWVSRCCRRSSSVKTSRQEGCSQCSPTTYRSSATSTRYTSPTAISRPR
jgi:DNA-binding transcriptional LysR family regulator